MRQLAARRASGSAYGIFLAVMLAAPLTVSAAWAQSDIPDYEGVDELEPIRLTMSEANSPAAMPQVTAFVDYVRAASRGKIEIEVFWSASLMGLQEAPEGLASGLADIAMTLPVYTPADYPVTNWVNELANQLGGGLPHGKLVANAVAEEFFLRNEPMQREFEEHGLYLLGATAQDAYDFLCSRPVSNLQEARGIRARIANQASAREVESLGMVATPILPGEMYEAFSRGIVDCIVCSPSCYELIGLTGVSGPLYWIDIDLSGWLIGFYLINKEKWDSLPAVAQSILVDGMTLNLQVDAENTYRQTQVFGDRIEAGAITAVAIDEEMASTLQAHQDRMTAEMPERAPPGVDDPQATIDQFMGLMDKWRRIVGDDLGIPRQPSDTQAIVESWNIDYDLGPYQRRLAEEVAKAYEELGR